MDYSSIGIAISTIATLVFIYNLFFYITSDADSRRIKNSKLWATAALFDDDGSSLLCYLLHRRRYPVCSRNEQAVEKKENYKRRMKKALIFMIAGMILSAF